jgi:hypothetical protein
MIERVPGVTALCARSSLEAMPSSVQGRCRWGIPPSVSSAANELQSGARSPWFGKVPLGLSPKTFRGAVAALGGPRAATVSSGPRVLGLMLLGLVTSRGVVLSSCHPYPRACKLLRCLAFPWCRRFKSSWLRVDYVYERGENLQPEHERHWSPDIGILPFEGHDAYCHALDRWGPARCDFSEARHPDLSSGSREVPRICVVRSVIPMGPFQIGSPSPLAKSGGAVPGPGCLAPVILLLLESVVPRLLGHNRQPAVLGV